MADEMGMRAPRSDSHPHRHRSIQSNFGHSLRHLGRSYRQVSLRRRLRYRTHMYQRELGMQH